MAMIQEIARQAALTKARELIGEDLVDEREVCALANAVAAAVQAALQQPSQETANGLDTAETQHRRQERVLAVRLNLLAPPSDVEQARRAVIKDWSKAAEYAHTAWSERRQPQFIGLLDALIAAVRQEQIHALAVMSASHEGERKAWSHKRQEQAAEIERLKQRIERLKQRVSIHATNALQYRDDMEAAQARAERAEAEIQRLKADLADALARRP